MTHWLTTSLPLVAFGDTDLTSISSTLFSSYMYVVKASKTMCVRKILMFNVDEIDNCTRPRPPPRVSVTYYLNGPLCLSHDNVISEFLRNVHFQIVGFAYGPVAKIDSYRLRNHINYHER